MARTSDPNAKVDLLRAAEAVFVERGLDHAKVEEITARAGKSKGAFYLHFESKEDAFRQIVETTLARLAACLDGGEAMQVAAVAEGPALLEALLDHDVEVFEFLWQNRALIRLLGGGGGSASFSYLVEEFAERCRGAVRRTIAWSAERGIVRPGLDVDLVSRILSGAYDQVARHVVRAQRKPDLRRLLGEVQHLFMHGIGGPAVRESDRPVRNASKTVVGRGRGGARTERRARPRKKEPARS